MTPLASGWKEHIKNSIIFVKIKKSMAFPPRKDKPKADPPKGKMSVGDALSYVKDNKLDPQEAFEFLKKHNSKALVIMRPDAWEKLEKNPDYKPPITKEEIDSHKSFMAKIEAMRGNEKSAAEIQKYLSDNGYMPPKSKVAYVMTGKSIIDNATKRGAKITPSASGDGSYEVFDDETTFKDTDKSYGKGRVIYPDVKYEKHTYNKGNDLVNVYKAKEYPTYSGRIPEQRDLDEYAGGKYYTSAVTPEMKKYYADVYFDPNNPDAKDKTYYGSQVTPEDIDRYKYAKELGEQIKPEYTKFTAEQKKKNRIRGGNNGSRGMVSNSQGF